MSVSDKVETTVLIDGHHGQYIPQVFAEAFGVDVISGENIDETELKATLSVLTEEFAGTETYWEAWVRIVDNVEVTLDGKKYITVQGESGDVFGINSEDFDNLSEDEQEEFWFNF